MQGVTGIFTAAVQRHVEDGNQWDNAADGVKLFPVTSIDPPLMILIKPPLRRIGCPDRLCQLLGDVGLQPQTGKGVPFISIAIP